jgi:hypothetical protein
MVDFSTFQSAIREVAAELQSLIMQIFPAAVLSED